MRHLICIPCAFASLVGCDAASGPTGIDSLPAALQMLDGASVTTESGTTAACRLGLVFVFQDEVHRSDTAVEHRGTMAGEARRTVLDANGDGFAPLLVGEATATLYVPDRLVLRVPVHKAADQRFY